MAENSTTVTVLDSDFAGQNSFTNLELLLGKYVVMGHTSGQTRSSNWSRNNSVAERAVIQIRHPPSLPIFLGMSMKPFRTNT